MKRDNATDKIKDNLQANNQTCYIFDIIIPNIVFVLTESPGDMERPYALLLQHEAV